MLLHKPKEEAASSDIRRIDSTVAAVALALALLTNASCADVLYEGKGDTKGGGTSEGANTTDTVGGGGQGGETMTGGTGGADVCPEIDKGDEPAYLTVEPPVFQVPGGTVGVSEVEVLKWVVQSSAAFYDASFINADEMPLFSEGDGFMKIRITSTGKVHSCTLRDSVGALDSVFIPNGDPWINNSRYLF